MPRYHSQRIYLYFAFLLAAPKSHLLKKDQLRLLKIHIFQSYFGLPQNASPAQLVSIILLFSMSGTLTSFKLVPNSINKICFWSKRKRSKMCSSFYIPSVYITGLSALVITTRRFRFVLILRMLDICLAIFFMSVDYSKETHNKATQ